MHWAYNAEERAAFERLRQLALGVQLYQALQTLGAAANAALQRRHLMVWAIFAPRFVFAASLRAVAALGAQTLRGLVLWNAWSTEDL